MKFRVFNKHKEVLEKAFSYDDQAEWQHEIFSQIKLLTFISF